MLDEEKEMLLYLLSPAYKEEKKTPSPAGEGLSEKSEECREGFHIAFAQHDRLLQLLPSGIQLPAFRALFSMEIICISAKCFHICFAARPYLQGDYSPRFCRCLLQLSQHRYLHRHSFGLCSFTARKVTEFPTRTPSP